MNLKDCYNLGYIAKTIGKEGELILKLDVDDPSNYIKLESVLIQMNKNEEVLVPFFVQKATLRNDNNLRISIEGIKTELEAKNMVGKKVFLPLNFLPPLSGNKFYFHEVIGFKLIDDTFGELSPIEDIFDLPNQAVFKITYKEKEVLIPINEHSILKVDRNNKEIFVSTPEGLIELYLNQ